MPRRTLRPGAIQAYFAAGRRKRCTRTHPARKSCRDDPGYGEVFGRTRRALVEHVMHDRAVMTTPATDPRDRLRARRAQLLARYRDTADLADEELATPARDPIDTASEQWDARVLSEMSDADARALDGVIAALRRLDAGTYGICAACHRPIEPARLALLPEAAECADCARFAEETPPRAVTSAGER